jgi:hypothetical protein
MADRKNIHSITGNQTTAGAAEETVLLTLDGAAPAASISVPVGTNTVITDMILGGNLVTMWRVQQTNNGGVAWFDIGLFNVTDATSMSTPIHTFNTGLVIKGGALVAFRVRVESPGGSSPVVATLRSYSEL